MIKKTIILSSIAVAAFLTSCQKSEELPEASKVVAGEELSEEVEVATADKAVVRKYSLNTVATTLRYGSWLGYRGSNAKFSGSSSRTYGTYKGVHIANWGYNLPSKVSNRTVNWSLKRGTVLKKPGIITLSPNKIKDVVGFALETVAAGTSTYAESAMILNVNGQQWAIDKIYTATRSGKSRRHIRLKSWPRGYPKCLIWRK